MIELLLHSDLSPKPSASFFKPLLQELLEISDKNKTTGQVSLFLVDNQRIQKLNQEYRQQDRATDVLSFLYSDPEKDSNIDGEIFISIEKAESQAQEYEQSFCSELARLFCHGLIHLLGMDHEILEQKDKFFKLEEKALENFWKRAGKNTNCIQLPQKQSQFE